LIAVQRQQEQLRDLRLQIGYHQAVQAQLRVDLLELVKDGIIDQEQREQIKIKLSSSSPPSS
jgi:hypothetical protein